MRDALERRAKELAESRDKLVGQLNMVLGAIAENQNALAEWNRYAEATAPAVPVIEENDDGRGIGFDEGPPGRTDEPLTQG